MPYASITEEFDHGKPRNKIVTYLAGHGESSAYQISRDLYRRVTDGYSTIAQNLKQLEEEGYVEFIRTVPSVKGGQQKLYALTPFLGIMLALASANDETKFVHRHVSNKEGYSLIWEGLRASLDVLGPNRFMNLVRESLLSLQGEIERRGKKMSQEKREERLLTLFIWPLLTEKATEKAIIKLCRDSQMIAGYLQDSYSRTLRILKRSGRVPSKSSR